MNRTFVTMCSLIVNLGIVAILAVGLLFMLYQY